jgi:RND family efflux transporter MFP subunit
MKLWARWLLVVLAVALAGGLVVRTLKARTAERAALGQPDSASLALELGAGDVFVARAQELSRTVNVSGGLKAVTSAIVKAGVAAEVKTLTVREGDRVQAGQMIGQLDTTEYEWRVRQAEQTAAAARTQLDIAKRTLDNNRALVEQGFISSTALETSVSSETGAQANYRAAQAAAELARKSRADARLVAPITGIVSQRLVQPGERVAIDATLIEIVDLSRIEVEAAMAPEDVGEVQIGQRARLQIDGLAEPVVASVARINPSTQAGTRAVMVYLALQPQATLRQGLFARGVIELQRRAALAVPASTVRVDQAEPYVLALVEGKVVQRSVKLGARGEALIDGRIEPVIEIAGGIADGTTLLRGSVGQVREGTPARLVGVEPVAAAR